MIADAGYSGTTLPRKLGLKPGQQIAFVGLPNDLAWLATAEAPARVIQPVNATDLEPGAGLDLVHAFYLAADQMRSALSALRAAIKPAGMIWISWPKKASKVPTDITEDLIRAAALDGGLVDVKVCAVSDIWSGLKLVIPVAQRPASR